MSGTGVPGVVQLETAIVQRYGRFSGGDSERGDAMSINTTSVNTTSANTTSDRPGQRDWFGLILSWLLAVLTVMLLASAAVMVIHAVPLMVRVEPQIWRAGVFVVIMLVLGVWHRVNLGQHIPYPTLLGTLAHIGGTGCLFLGSVALLFLTLALVIGRTVGWDGEAGKVLLLCILGPLLFPISYYSGRIIAYLLTGSRIEGVIPETDPRSPHHPHASGPRSPSDFYTVPQDHWVSFLMSWIPAVMSGTSAAIVYKYLSM